jgi:serine/threonine-protein kinase ULK4
MLLQQLLGGILDVNSSYVSVVDELELSQCFFDFLTLEHPNNNVHNIRLCRQLVLSGCICTSQLLQLQAADKVSWMALLVGVAHQDIGMPIKGGGC